MADDLEIRGAQALASLGKTLRRVGGGKELRKEFLRELRLAGKPVNEAVKRSLDDGLPKKGGAASQISRKTRVGVRNRLTGDSAGVRLEVAKKGSDIPALDQGTLRHPLFGNRKHWYSQRIEPDLITRAVEETVPVFGEAVLRAIDTVAAKIEESA